MPQENKVIYRTEITKEISEQEVKEISNKDIKIICEICGFANEQYSFMCSKCSNLLNTNKKESKKLWPLKN